MSPGQEGNKEGNHGCCDLVDEGTHGLALAEVALRAMGLNGVGLTYGALTHW
jgi:hypothetical protein